MFNVRCFQGVVTMAVSLSESDATLKKLGGWVRGTRMGHSK